MRSFQGEIRGIMVEDDRCGIGIHKRLLPTGATLVIEDTGFAFDPDEGSVGPTRRTMALGTIDHEVLAMGRLRRYSHRS